MIGLVNIRIRSLGGPSYSFTVPSPFSEATGGFLEYQPSDYDYLRGIILFGQNQASYKFALGKSLLELASQGREAVSLDELAVPFSKHVCAHLQNAPKQGHSKKSEFLDGCRRYNNGEIEEVALFDHTRKHGFNAVIKAFHKVGRIDVPTRFFLDERKSSTKGIILTPEIHAVCAGAGEDVAEEIEARWRLVETAWDLEINTSLILYDSSNDQLTSRDRRRQVTSARPALNGYQRGKCFYCNRHVEIISGSSDLAHVDHVFPHTLQRHGIMENLDQVWNLVLACVDCNLGKSDAVPDSTYVEKLETRNNYLIHTHHPLTDTLIRQTGQDPALRHQFLQKALDLAREHQPSVWSTKPQGDSAF